MAPVDDFFRKLDGLWGPPPDRIRLNVIGSAALMIQFDYQRGTKDGDVLQTQDIAGPIKDQLLRLADRGSALHARTRMYLDIVPNGLPFLPSPPRWLPVDRLAALTHLDLQALDVVDVVVSKLKRFNANDVDDIRAMVDRDLVLHEALLERFRSAFAVFAYDARAPELIKYVANLNQVERDLLGVEETSFTDEIDALRY